MRRITYKRPYPQDCRLTYNPDHHYRPLSRRQVGCFLVVLAVLLVLSTALALLVLASRSNGSPAHEIALQAAPGVKLTPTPAGTESRHSETSCDAGLSADPFRRCAEKAVRGDYNPVPAWKLTIYREALERGVTCRGVAKRTTYCPLCAGRYCADGSHVRRGICAANRQVPMHSWVWVASDGLLKVCDRGGRVTLGYTNQRETANFDVWVPDCAGGCWTGPGTKRNMPWALVKGAGSP